MSIEHILEDATKEQYIKKTNKNFNFLDGRYKKYDISAEEIVAIIASCSLDTKMLRDVGLGNTISSYTNWTHEKAYDAYSIWKIAVSNYAHNVINQLYLDGAPLTYMGQAASVTLTSFDYVLFYDGATYTDNSTEAASEEGTPFTVLAETDDYLYIIDSSTFGKIDFAFSQWGANVTLKVEYSKGSGVWGELLSTANNLVDNTNDFASDGLIEYTPPSDWATDTVDAKTGYCIRISTTTSPTTVPKAYYITPGDSVYSLLSLSNTQIQDTDWAWCYYGGYVYITIPNYGYSAYEGQDYIKSTSSDANLKNFFVYNHQYTIDHEDSTYLSYLGSHSYLSYDDATLSGTPIVLRFACCANYYYCKAYPTVSSLANSISTEYINNPYSIQDTTLSGTPVIFEYVSGKSRYYFKTYPEATGIIYDAGDLIVRRLNAHPDATLSGTPRIAKVEVNGTSYYFKVYPNNSLI